jgi:FkbM family methyltransferase
MKQILKALLSGVGYELRKKKVGRPADGNRPVGNMYSFLEDLKERGLKCETLLDVGANKAEWSFMFKEIYKEAACFLIEPLEECRPEMERFVAEHMGSNYFLCAAGSENAQKVITVWNDLYGSSLLPETNTEKLKSGKQREIAVRTIDDMIRDGQIPVPEIVKIDVQGYELEALRGATLLFGHTELFILEVSLISFDDVPGMPELKEVVDFMFEKGYVAYDFPGFLRRPLDGALGQCDIAFAKKEGSLRASNKWK